MGTCSLKKKTLIGIVILTAVLSSIVLTVSYQTYLTKLISHYENLSMNIASTVSLMIDADEVEQEHYDNIELLFTELKEKSPRMSFLLANIDIEHKSCTYLVDSWQGTLLNEAGSQGVLGTDKYNQITPVEAGGFLLRGKAEGNDEYSFAAAPIKSASGEIVCHIMVATSLDSVKAEHRENLPMLILIVLGVTSVAMLCASFIVHKILVGPINLLASAANSYISDKETIKSGECSAIDLLKIKTGDEIEHLADSIKQMELDIDHYIENLTKVTAEKERIGAELSVATNIQANMLPSIFPAFPDREEFDIYATMDPAKEVGGDFYDFFLLDEDHLALVMADVAGKGVPAALFMVIAKTLLKNAAQMGLSVKEIFEKVNNQLCENNEEEMFVTVWMGILQISTGNMTCVNAGHEYPTIKRKGGMFELYKDPHGFVLAGDEDLSFREYEIQLEEGDTIYVYTDGVPEATNDDYQMFGNDRMMTALNNQKAESLQALLHNMKQEIDEFVKEAPQSDDITMLALVYRGKQSVEEREL